MAPPTLYNSRRRKPSAEIEHPRKVASLSLGKKPPAKAKAGPAKKKTTMSKAPRKNARAGAKEGNAEKPVDNDVCADKPDKALKEEKEPAAELGAKRLPAKRRVEKPSKARAKEPEPVPREASLKSRPMCRREESDDEELDKMTDLLVAQILGRPGPFAKS